MSPKGLETRKLGSEPIDSLKPDQYKGGSTNSTTQADLSPDDGGTACSFVGSRTYCSSLGRVIA